MPVTTILLLRHGHRLAWTLDPTTGEYSSSHPYPTRLPADPPLAAYGVCQAQETGAFLATELLEAARGDRLRLYSSLYYRCWETLRPTVEGLRRALENENENEDQSTTSTGNQSRRRELLVRGERGLGEWFGRAWFAQPQPASAARLKREFFPWADDGYTSLVIPDEHGEGIDELHDRVALALEMVMRDVDREYEAMGQGQEDVTVLICGHAAQIIASGRALTGEVPGDYDEEDFQCYTCGISRFVRRPARERLEEDHTPDVDPVAWRTNGGVAGGWECVLNSDCAHLSMGAERGWHFHGDESFDSYGPGMKPATVKVSDGRVHETRELKQWKPSPPKL